MPERLIGTDCKSVAFKRRFGGSNPLSAPMITQHEVHTFIHNEPLLEAASCCVALNTFDASTFQKKAYFLV